MLVGGRVAVAGSLSGSVLTGTCGYLAVVAVLPTWCLPPAQCWLSVQLASTTTTTYLSTQPAHLTVTGHHHPSGTASRAQTQQFGHHQGSDLVKPTTTVLTPREGVSGDW